MINYQLCDIE